MRYFSTTEPEENDTNLREKLPPSRSLFIANIPWTAVDNDIRELFSSYGTIQRVYLCMFDFLFFFFFGTLIINSV